MKKLLAAMAVTALMASGANAALFNGEFDISGSAFADPGLVLNVHPSSGPVSLDLDVGESVTFDLFRVWTNERSVNHDDYQGQSVNVAFNMTSPSTSGVLGGTSSGNSHTFGFFQGGNIYWSNPLQLSFGKNGTGLLEISLSDQSFNWGAFWGTVPGKHHGATVKATATYVVAPVPLPASALLLLGGLGGLAFMRRRKQQAA